MNHFRGHSVSAMAAAVGLSLTMTSAQAQLFSGGSYLALGDSAPFGSIASDGYARLNPKNFLGYPDYISGPRFETVNAACPGETSSSFISISAANNGCIAYRASFPLHVNYTSSQMAFATNFLATHTDTQLVTLQIGANDGLALAQACNGDLACIQAGLPQLALTLSLNMNTILGGLRATGFQGVIVVVNSFSPDYTDPVLTGLVQLLNQTLAAVAAANGAVIADTFTAFKQAASTPFAGGKTCKTALLNVNPSDPTQQTCDTHPALSGHLLIA